MGIAAYNRGSRAIRRQIDQELMQKRIAITLAKEEDRHFIPGVPVDDDTCKHRRICFFDAFAVCQDCGAEAPAKTMRRKQ